MKFLLLHGSFGSPKANWFPYLKNNLEKLQQSVVVPAFPVNRWEEVTENGQQTPTEKQNLENWVHTFKPVYESIKNEKDIHVVGHSLACVFILHLVEQYNISFQSAFFVAPFLEKLNKMWQIDVANATFYKKDFDFEKMRQAIPKSFAIYGNDDPYVAQHFINDFANKMGSEKIMIPGGKHLNSDAGYTEFPLLLDLIKTKVISSP